jgi:hypothetical protein
MISINHLFEQEKTLEKEKKMNVGVIGYSAQKFDEVLAKKLILEGLNKIGIENISCIVSGLTNIGIPKIAYEIATELKLETIGIACKLANDYDLFPVDKEIIVGDNWGDESETFLNYIDCLIKVGGGKQSEEEYKKFNKTKFKFELPAMK